MFLLQRITGTAWGQHRESKITKSNGNNGERGLAVKGLRKLRFIEHLFASVPPHLIFQKSHEWVFIPLYNKEIIIFFIIFIKWFNLMTLYSKS